jgi:hypothetical protein
MKKDYKEKKERRRSSIDWVGALVDNVDGEFKLSRCPEKSRITSSVQACSAVAVQLSSRGLVYDRMPGKYQAEHTYD